MTQQVRPRIIRVRKPIDRLNFFSLLPSLNRISFAYSQNPGANISVYLVCEGEKCDEMLGGTEFEVQTLDKADEKVKWEFELKVNGLVTISIHPVNVKELKAKNIEIHNSHSIKQLRVGKSHALEIGSTVIGYIYFFAWMISLYPILIT